MRLLAGVCLGVSFAGCPTGRQTLECHGPGGGSAKTVAWQGTARLSGLAVGETVDDFWVVAIEGEAVAVPHHFDGAQFTRAPLPGPATVIIEVAGAGPGAVWILTRDGGPKSGAESPQRLLRLRANGTYDDLSAELGGLVGIGMKAGEGGLFVTGAEAAGQRILRWDGTHLVRVEPPPFTSPGGRPAPPPGDMRPTPTAVPVAVRDLSSMYASVDMNLFLYDGAWRLVAPDVRYLGPVFLAPDGQAYTLGSSGLVMQRLEEGGFRDLPGWKPAAGPTDGVVAYADGPIRLRTDQCTMVADAVVAGAQVSRSEFALARNEVFSVPRPSTLADGSVVAIRSLPAYSVLIMGAAELKPAP